MTHDYSDWCVTVFVSVGNFISANPSPSKKEKIRHRPQFDGLKTHHQKEFIVRSAFKGSEKGADYKQHRKHFCLKYHQRTNENNKWIKWFNPCHLFTEIRTRTFWFPLWVWFHKCLTLGADVWLSLLFPTGQWKRFFVVRGPWVPPQPDPSP